jgi:hypothetical protein
VDEKNVEAGFVGLDVVAALSWFSPAEVRFFAEGD